MYNKHLDSDSENIHDSNGRMLSPPESIVHKKQTELCKDWCDLGWKYHHRQYDANQTAETIGDNRQYQIADCSDCDTS